jgi:hypothetical protein
MTEARANELYRQFQSLPIQPPLIRLVNAEENAAVNAVWERLPGSTCWMDAFFTFMTPSLVPPYQRQRNEYLRSILASNKQET